MCLCVYHQKLLVGILPNSQLDAVGDRDELIRLFEIFRSKVSHDETSCQKLLVQSAPFGRKHTSRHFLSIAV